MRVFQDEKKLPKHFFKPYGQVRRTSLQVTRCKVVSILRVSTFLFAFRTPYHVVLIGKHPYHFSCTLIAMDGTTIGKGTGSDLVHPLSKLIPTHAPTLMPTVKPLFSSHFFGAEKLPVAAEVSTEKVWYHSGKFIIPATLLTLLLFAAGLFHFYMFRKRIRTLGKIRRNRMDEDEDDYSVGRTVTSLYDYYDTKGLAASSSGYGASGETTLSRSRMGKGQASKYNYNYNDTDIEADAYNDNDNGNDNDAGTSRIRETDSLLGSLGLQEEEREEKEEKEERADKGSGSGRKRDTRGTSSLSSTSSVPSVPAPVSVSVSIRVDAINKASSSPPSPSSSKNMTHTTPTRESRGGGESGGGGGGGVINNSHHSSPVTPISQILHKNRDSSQDNQSHFSAFVSVKQGEQGEVDEERLIAAASGIMAVR